MRTALLLLVACCSAEIERGLDAAKADEAQRTLKRAGIAATLEHGQRGISVRVAGDDAARALDAMRAKGEVQEPSLVPTPMEERARYEEEIAADLAATIARLPGVVDARVHLAAPQREPLVPDDTPAPHPRASVMIQARVLGVSRDDVRRLVAGAVDGLDPTAVSVVVTKAEPLPTPPPARGAPLAALGVASALVAALALALVFAIAYARSLREKLRVTNGRMS